MSYPVTTTLTTEMRSINDVFERFGSFGKFDRFYLRCDALQILQLIFGYRDFGYWVHETTPRTDAATGGHRFLVVIIALWSKVFDTHAGQAEIILTLLGISCSFPAVRALVRVPAPIQLLTFGGRLRVSHKFVIVLNTNGLNVDLKCLGE